VTHLNRFNIEVIDLSLRVRLHEQSEPYSKFHRTIQTEESIWSGRSWVVTFKHLFDSVIYALLTAGTPLLLISIYQSDRVESRSCLVTSSDLLAIVIY